jgi:F-type H+-transporting ATPase subunit b
MRSDPSSGRIAARGCAWAWVCAILLLALALPLAARVTAQQPHEPASAAVDAHASAPAHASEEGEEHGSGWLATIAKIFNFAVLVAVLAYFLKSPLATYLSSRISRVREDLVAAAATREEASRRLAGIQAKLQSLPSELETLKARGAEEIVAERQRIEQAAEAERQRLLAHTRREIEMHYRVARRQILEQTAALAVSVASDRIKQTMTLEDQARLVDRYASQIAGGAQ